MNILILYNVQAIYSDRKILDNYLFIENGPKYSEFEGRFLNKRP